jgi:hypothetical protein
VATVTARRVRLIEVVRVGYGTAVVVAPRRMQRLLGVAPDGPTTAVARVLGVRQVVQGLLSGVAPGPEVVALGVWVDTLHSLSMVALAGIDRRRARAGLTDAVVAGSFAALGAGTLVTGPPAGPPYQGLRDELAGLALRHLPGGRTVLRLAGGDR